MTSRDDELIALIARCAIRDQTALKDLFDRLGPFLNSVALRIVRSEDASNDVLQEAFIQIWQNASSYRPHLSKPLTWLTSIVRYRALDRFAQEKSIREKIDVDASEDEITSIADESCPLQTAVTDQMRNQLASCLDSLSTSIKESVELAYLHGYSRDEIAERMNTNSNTVKSWLHRGAQRLKQCLETRIQTI
ncbi:MAG: RNA polymerase sigma factor [Marinagarivorans sp.]